MQLERIACTDSLPACHHRKAAQAEVKAARCQAEGCTLAQASLLTLLLFGHPVANAAIAENFSDIQ